MKAFKDYETTKSLNEFQTLPAGGYPCKIIAAKVVTYTGQTGQTYDKLEIAFDIVEGEYANYFKNDYDARTGEMKKWKGVFRLSVPTDDGSDGDNWAKRVFRTCIEAVEDSNPGYHWDWYEAGLKGKFVGVLFRNEEWEYNGKTGWKAMPFRFIQYQDAQTGNFKIPKEKPLKRNDVPTVAPMSFEAAAAAVNSDDDDKLPWE